MANIDGTPGDDSLAGGGSDDFIRGFDGNDTLSGLGGVDILRGAHGNDTLDGGIGNDTLSGGQDNDTINGGAGDDLLGFSGGNDADQEERGSDHLIGGDGNDRMMTYDGGDIFEGGAGTDTLLFDPQGSGVTVDLAAGTASGGSTVSGIENVEGTDSVDTLTGGAGSNRLTGNWGEDVLDGGGGNDTLIGGPDRDTLIGGTGDDILQDNVALYQGLDILDDLDGGDGNDTASYQVSRTPNGLVIDLVAGTINGQVRLTGIENVLGSHSGGDTITGNAVANILIGNNGDDTLHGGAGNDRLEGGNGSDSLYGDAGDDVLVDSSIGTTDLLDGGDGTDTADYHLYSQNIYLNLQLGIGGGTGNITLVSIENLIGTIYSNDTLIGDGGSNVLDGLAGKDSLQGGGGDDVLRGGAGADQLNGGAGSDTASYYTSKVGVTVDLGAGTGTGDAVGDTFIDIENLTGSGQGSDTLIGTAGANILSGWGGSDLLRGGAGADTLDGGIGVDTATYYSSTAAVTVDLAAGSGSGGDAQGDTLIDIENLTGSNLGGDTLIGAAGANALAGWGGDDVLRGGAGADTLDGGAGSDTASYYTGAAGVTVNLTTGAGTGGDAQGDTLVSIENLAGSNLGNDSLIGNAGANTLSGLGGDDVLRGGAGADRLDGGDGSDTASYYTGTVGVTVNLTAGTGSGGDAQGDTYAGIENVTGSAGADQITGSAVANALNGWAGQDVLRGGGGADRFVFTATGDSKVGAADRITDFSHAQGDRVDLSAIDANTGIAGNQAFSFIGTGGFTHHAGELRYAVAGGITTIAGDVNGDGASDFHIQLTGAIALVAADFVL
ncbi:MAG: beta strand repeat-containing protein [Inquilinus sp.]|uniref:beta strand repeat-containing protein n=1 Tax=Inquilinus sp. TaxID=1932117 RepID=UPI003F32FDD3